MILLHFFFRTFSKGLTRSRSVPGIKSLVSSTIVTSLPRAEYMVAISRPMIPPPMIKIFDGISLGSNAPVESIILGSSGIKLSSAGSDPTAMMNCSDEIVCDSPRCLIVISFLDENVAVP